MNLFEKLDICLDKEELISIVGGGGKTTTMFRLANELVKFEKKILIGTTTAILNPHKSTYDRLMTLDTGYSCTNIPKGSITVIAGETTEAKLFGVDKEVIDKIYESKIFDYIIIETDGAKMRPIKAPADHEPVIPSLTTKNIGVIGTDCIGKTIDEEYVHRPEILTKITNSKIGDTIDSEIIYRLVTSEDGIFKSTPQNSKKYLILNKAESEDRKGEAIKVKEMLIKSKFNIEDVIIGSMRGD